MKYETLFFYQSRNVQVKLIIFSIFFSQLKVLKKIEGYQVEKKAKKTRKEKQAEKQLRAEKIREAKKRVLQ